MVLARATPDSAVAPLRPAVPPVPPGAARPLVSVVVPTYESARFLEQTLDSVLVQDLGSELMEVVVVDDASVRDDPGEVVRRRGEGRVRFVRQPENLGHVRTFNACLALTRGHWVHLLHGDDLVLPGFYDAFRAAVETREDLGAFLCRFAWADEEGVVDRPGWLLAEQAGVLPDWPERLGRRQQLEAPSIVVRRSVYEHVGGFDEGVAGYGEDWEMWVRVAVTAPVWYEPTPLAVYRVRPGSLSDPSRLKRNMKDMRRVMALNAGSLSAVLPPDRVRAVTRQAHHDLAVSQLRLADNARRAGSRGLPWVPVREAVRLHTSIEVLARSAVLLARTAADRLRGTTAKGHGDAKGVWR